VKFFRSPPLVVATGDGALELTRTEWRHAGTGVADRTNDFSPVQSPE
jgi:hypothetical protein